MIEGREEEKDYTVIYRYRYRPRTLEIYYNWSVDKFFCLYVARSCLEAWSLARSLARSFTCLSLEVLSLINPYTGTASRLSCRCLPRISSLPPSRLGAVSACYGYTS